MLSYECFLKCRNRPSTPGQHELCQKYYQKVLTTLIVFTVLKTKFKPSKKHYYFCQYATDWSECTLCTRLHFCNKRTWTNVIAIWDFESITRNSCFFPVLMAQWRKNSQVMHVRTAVGVYLFWIVNNPETQINTLMVMKIKNILVLLLCVTHVDCYFGPFTPSQSD